MARIGKNQMTADTSSQFASQPSPAQMYVRQPYTGSVDIDAMQSELVNKINDLELEIDRLSTTRSTIDTRQHSASPAIEAVSETGEEEQARVQIEMGQQMDLLEYTLQTEMVDSGWSDRATVELNEAFRRDTSSGLELLQADCRGSMCRIDVGYNSKAPEESFRMLQGVIPWDGEAFFHIENIDSGQATLYLAREGNQLPRPM